MSEAYIYDAIRTPIGRGSSRGALYEVKPINLLAVLLAHFQLKYELETAQVNDVLIGCVTPVDDQGYNLAKAALLYAGWSEQVCGLQLNRYGASGLEAINLAAVKVRSGWAELVVAGGVECMSRVSKGSDGGPLIYDPEVINRIPYLPQGVAADLLATLNGFTRKQVDTYALRSHQRAGKAQREGYFEKSVAPIRDRNGLLLLERDEHLRPNLTLEALTEMPAAFAKAGRAGFDALARQKYPHLEKIHHLHTLGNSAGIADGAALTIVGSREKGEALGIRPRAKIRAVGNKSVDPTLMLAAAAPAAREALNLAGMTAEDIDLWECSEAFAAVALKFQQDMDIDPALLNVNGGGIALGHPLGAAGAISIGHLIDELERRDLTTGLLSMSAAGGMGVATIVERV